MPEFNLDAVLIPERGGNHCPTCGQVMSFEKVHFEDFGAWAKFTCIHGCGVGDWARSVDVPLVLVEVVAHLQAPVGDPMELVLDSRCLYGCGRSSISTGAAYFDTESGEVQVQMSCDACDGDWHEYYRLGEVADA